MAITDPRKRRDDAPLPVVHPGSSTGPTLQGYRQLRDLPSVAQVLQARRGQVTAATPQSEIDRRVARAPWNASFGSGPGAGMQSQSSLTGGRYMHEQPVGFLRPASGPQSAPAVAAQADLQRTIDRPTAPAATVTPVLARPGGSVRPTGRPSVAAAAAPAPAAVPANFAGVRGGVASSAPTSLVDQGVTVTGADGVPRKLSYGAMVGGVPTFSDGRGNSGIPRTVSDEEIQSLGGRLGRADAGALAKPLASDALGYTPSSEQMVAQNIAQLRRPGGEPNEALRGMLARSEANAIASGDWRSASGTVAHNLGVEASSGTPRQRRMAEQSLVALQTGAQQRAQDQSAFAREELGQEGQNARTVATIAGQAATTAAEQQGQNQRAMLNWPGGQQVTLADGTLGVLNPRTGEVTMARTADGKPAKSATAKASADVRRTQALRDELAANAAKLIQQAQGLSAEPLTEDQIGQIKLTAARSMPGARIGKDEAGHTVVRINGQDMLL